MISSKRLVATVEQGQDEEIVYALSPLAETGTVSGIIVRVWEEQPDGSWSDVTNTVMPVNSPTSTTTSITLSPLKLLTIDKRYRVEVKFTQLGQVKEPYIVVECKR